LPTGDRAANLEQAIECYREALRVYTPEAAPLDYAMTQNNLGIAYRNLPTGDRAANLEQAIECYREALRIEYLPSWSQTRYLRSLGDAYGELEDYASAIAAYRQAIELNPDDPWLFNALGNAYSRQDQHEQAVEAYTAALDRQPEAGFHFDRGLAHLALGQQDQTLADYQAAIPLADSVTIAEALKKLNEFATDHPDTPGLDALRALLPSPS